MSGRMSCGCGFWYGMSVASATVSGRGLFKILISRNWVMVDGCLAYPNGGISDRVPNTFHLLLPSFQWIQSNIDIPVNSSRIFRLASSKARDAQCLCDGASLCISAVVVQVGGLP